MSEKILIEKVKEVIESWNGEEEESKPFPIVMKELEEIYNKLPKSKTGTFTNTFTGKEEDITRSYKK